MTKMGYLPSRSNRGYYSATVAECGNIQKSLFGFRKNLMEDKEEILLPSGSSGDCLTSKFTDFFGTKIVEMRDTIDADNTSVSETVVMDSNVGFEGERLILHST